MPGNGSKVLITLYCSFVLFLCTAQTIKTQLLIVGGGASGTTAGIQASRMGIKTIIVEETGWLGGMLTSGGVSAIDGNHKLPSGLWGEFRQRLYDYYGGPQSVETGWVSNTLFEPSVGDSILKQMAANHNLQVLYKTQWLQVKRVKNRWQVTIKKDHKTQIIEAELLVDATELGDIMAALKVPYRIGMDSRNETGEAFAPEQSDNVIQDLTYVVTLKDYGKGADKTIEKPAGYKPEDFSCACNVEDVTVTGKPNINCASMLQYGRLPYNKYMINWPRCGNDFYLNIIEKTAAQREIALKEAKLQSLRFIYFIQTALGYKNLGLAGDEYPSADKLPMIPYYRESRRMTGLVTLSINYMAQPYNQPYPYYRTGIATGDYPVDHHHAKNLQAPKIDFAHIKIPSYNIPLGALIPAEVSGLIVAEKSISVTNIANGATRLQPVVLEIGQAAGALAAICIRHHIRPSNVNIREVQSELLQANVYLLPFDDVAPQDPGFKAVQRIGATGILKGTGISANWANETRFYPDSTISRQDLLNGLSSYYPSVKAIAATDEPVITGFIANIFMQINPAIKYDKMIYGESEPGLTKMSDKTLPLTRMQVVVLIDRYLNPFSRRINFNGEPEEIK